MWIFNNRIAFVSLAALIIAGSWSCSTENKKHHEVQDPIFREITLNEGVIVSLGQDIVELEELCVKNDEVYSLNEGTFSNSSAINLSVNDDNQIKSIHFYYETSHGVEFFVERYTDVFKANPVEATYKTDSITMNVYIWQDEHSNFEIVEFTENDELRVYSGLFDRKLYLSERLKRDLDSNVSNNSMEITRVRMRE